jgi:hypothetical protein
VEFFFSNEAGLDGVLFRLLGRAACGNFRPFPFN